MSLTDKEYEAVDRRVKALVHKWVKPLGLGWWRVTVSVVRHPSEMPETGNIQRGDPQWQCVMSTHVSWAYRDGKVSVNAEAAHDADDERLEAYFLHELGHVFVNEMRSIATNDGLRDGWIEHEEHVVTSIGQALGWAYRAGRDSAKRKRK